MATERDTRISDLYTELYDLAAELLAAGIASEDEAMPRGSIRIILERLSKRIDDAAEMAEELDDDGGPEDPGDAMGPMDEGGDELGAEQL